MWKCSVEEIVRCFSQLMLVKADYVRVIEYVAASNR